MRRLITLLLVLFAIPLMASAQPAWFPDGDWQELGQPYQMYVQGEDSAWVYPAQNGEYGRAQDGEEWRFHCPGMIEDDYWTLSGTTSDLGAVQEVAESLVEDGETVALPPQVFEKAECINAMWLHLDTLMTEAVIPGREKPQTYATECTAHPDNATIHVPASADFYGVREPSAGDTLAVYSPEDQCVGWGVWTEDGATMAAAQKDTVGGVEGLTPGEEMTLEVYQGGRAYLFTDITWAACPLDDPLCGSGTYQADRVYSVAELTLVI